MPRISQETLARIVGATRGRVSFFMNKFRELGFIEYNEACIQVHSFPAEHTSSRPRSRLDLALGSAVCASKTLTALSLIQILSKTQLELLAGPLFSFEQTASPGGRFERMPRGPRRPYVT